MTLVSPVDVSSPQAGGTRTYVLGLADRLHRRGIPVSLVARGTSSPIQGVGFEPIRSGPHGERFLLRLLASAFRLPIPPGSVIHAQRPDTLVAFRFAKRNNPKVCTLHGVPSLSVYGRRGTAYGVLYDLLERMGLRGVDRAIAVDAGTERWYANRYPWLAKRIAVIPVAVDITLFRPLDRDAARRRFGVREPRAILYAGRLSPEKRVGTIIQALHAVPQTELMIAGDGVEEPMLRELARGLRVRFLGSVPHADMPELLNAADVLVLASEFEGLPTIALEALACGTPIVAPPVGALASLVVPGITGWLFPNPQELATVLRDALPKASGVREACREASKAFSWDLVSERILAVYREVAA